jgi:hypothetical protein
MKMQDYTRERQPRGERRKTGEWCRSEGNLGHPRSTKSYLGSRVWLQKRQGTKRGTDTTSKQQVWQTVEQGGVVGCKVVAGTLGWTCTWKYLIFAGPL